MCLLKISNIHKKTTTPFTGGKIFIPFFLASLSLFKKTGAIKNIQIQESATIKLVESTHKKVFTIRKYTIK